jgi:hypothetical protein
MKTKKFHYILPVCFACLLSLFSLSCKQKSYEGKLIVTLAPAGKNTLNFVTGEGWRYIPGSQIVVVDPEKPASEKILTRDFYSACSPDVSWDGNMMLFAGQKKENDPWEIWEMDLKTSKYHKINDSLVDCTDPVCLPLEKLVFSKKITGGSSKTGHALYTCKSDGSETRQITFAPVADFATMVLMDGRLLTLSRQVLPQPADPEVKVLRPDGTKNDPFYKGNAGTVLLNRCRESCNGRIYLVEMDTLSKRGNIVSISYNRPSQSKEVHTAQAKGNFRAVYPVSDNKFWVSYQDGSAKEPFALYEYDAAQEKVGKKIYGNEKMDVTDVILVHQHDRPKKLPSEVDLGVKTGLLICLDLNFSEQQILHPAADFKKASGIVVLGIDTTYGVVKAEEDGSIYLKVMADVPFRIQTLDQNGKVVTGPGAWMWLRPNERRGFVSFYNNPEIAPENIVPLAIKKAPVIIPVVVTKVNEKEVELE